MGGEGGAGFFSCQPCQRTLRGLLIGRWRHGGKLILHLAEDIGVRTSRGSRIHRASPAPWQAAPKRWRRPRGSAGSGTPSHLEVPPGLWRLGPGRLPAYFPAMSPRGREVFPDFAFSGLRRGLLTSSPTPPPPHRVWGEDPRSGALCLPIRPGAGASPPAPPPPLLPLTRGTYLPQRAGGRH